MTPLENLHYAMGELAYSVARVDGKVQNEERTVFRDMVIAELRSDSYAFDVSDIVFQVMCKDKTDSATTYKWAMDEIRLNSHYLSPELKETFIRVMEKVAGAFPPVTADEKNLIDRFKKDIVLINGDPVFYERVQI